MVISVLVVLPGLIYVQQLPIAQYPEIAPPSVQVITNYPGASSEVVAETVASPIEQQVTGVENMIFMSSQSTNDGSYILTVTFENGTDLDMAQVLVQNRVNLAMPTLPPEVKTIGVQVLKSSPNALLAISLFSPDQSRDQLYLSNYSTIRLKDEIARLDGVGRIFMLGERNYSMRVWMDPDRMATLGLTATDVIAALREQNIQVAAGALGSPPIPEGMDFQYTLKTLGRLRTADEFAEIVVKTGADGQVIKLSDIVSERRTTESGQVFGGLDYGAQKEDMSSSLDGVPSAGMMIFQRPGSNAIETAKSVRAKMQELKTRFPIGVDYAITYDTTPFVSESIHEVFKALRDAIFLVGIVVLVFLQSWRAALIPLIAVPVAIIGTFAVMAAIGFSLNNLSLLGLVLAIGIVVDDAIVVVEAIEHKLDQGIGPKQAAFQAMSEVTAPIVGITSVLMCVFIPCLFISGITGQFFKQFAATIAVSTFFSGVNSLSLSPALAALLLRPKDAPEDWLTKLMNVCFGWFFKIFNATFEKLSAGYAVIVKGLLRTSLIALAIYGGLMFFTYHKMSTTPTGFVPAQDKGYLIVDVQLPDSASHERTQAVINKLNRILLGDRVGRTDLLTSNDDEHADHNAPWNPKDGMKGVKHSLAVSGFSFVQITAGSNFGALFAVLDHFENRKAADVYSDRIAERLRKAVAEEVTDAKILILGPPPVDGLGTGGGFKVMVRDIGDIGLSDLQRVANNVSQAGMAKDEVAGMQTGFRASTPQMFVDVDREKCKTLNVPLSEVFTALQAYLGAYYVNDFNAFGRTWQVNIQADPMFRLDPSDVTNLYVRNLNGGMVPLGTVATVKDTAGPALVQRYNGFAAAGINGITTPGVSSGDMIKSVEATMDETLPFGFDMQWTDLTYMQIQAGDTSLIVFALSVVLVFLVLAAQYESLKLPMAVILVVPMCLLASILGVSMAGLDMNIFVQIGFVVLVGLASKNAILIVEYAKEQQEQKGMSKYDATIEACRLRLRPIIMTSLAFILGVVPLVLANGAGAEMRRTLGIAVFSGMLGVTFFGVFLTPVFFYVIATKTENLPKPIEDDPSPATSGGDSPN